MGKQPSDKPIPKILIVDDEPDIALILSGWLVGWGYPTPDSAWSARTALELMRARTYGLVLLDILMPEASGMELLAEIQKMDAPPKVIMVTASTALGRFEEAARLGAHGFIYKPFGPEEVRQKIEEALEETEESRMVRLVSIQSEEIDRLRKTVESLSRQRSQTSLGKVLERYRLVCGAATHDLRGELLHIASSLEEIKVLAGDSEDVMEECEVIDRSVNYAKVLLQRLTDGVEIGGTRIQTVVVEDLMETVRSLVVPRLPRSVALAWSVSTAAKKQRVSANPEQLLGILLQLLSNAANVLRESGGKVQLSARGGNGDHIVFGVSDDGPGIPKSIRKALFRDRVPSKYGGLGMGLLLSSKLAEEMGGSLTLASTSSRGTHLELVLPLESGTN